MDFGHYPEGGRYYAGSKRKKGKAEVSRATFFRRLKEERDA